MVENNWGNRTHFLTSWLAPQSAQKPVQSEEIETSGEFPDKIADAVNEKFYEICDMQKNDDFHKEMN